MAAVPLLASLVAVIVAAPAATPVTTPLELTVATATSLVAQLTTRPLSAFPAESLGVALSGTELPTATLAVAGLTLTVATGTTTTVTAALPLFPPLVAVIVAVPAETPVTRPLPFTLAAPPLLLVQVIVRPLSGLPAESSAVALSCSVLPTATRPVAGLTLTVATGTTTTVAAALPLLPPLVAVIVAVPAEMPVTRPLPFTLAAPPLLLVHVMVRPLSGLPAESSAVALSCSVLPTATRPVAGLTLTVATGTTTTVAAALPLLPPLVAVIVAVPAEMPVTRPLPFTLAAPPLLLVHVMVRPL